ncbi:uncharacterized protein DS421_3g92570 [Arachis hypogaea]|nr:uncharacterized protein DS421_3g92570 [Arachis hypogaea]QHO58666.1 uncharacterized protein DS421_3g92570 [Arachis hypogaea]
MGRNIVRNALSTMLMIGAIVYYGIAEFQDKSNYISYDDETKLDKCLDSCLRKHRGDIWEILACMGKCYANYKRS